MRVCPAVTPKRASEGLEQPAFAEGSGEGTFEPPSGESATTGNALEFFKGVAGRWHLEYEKRDGMRSEDLEIDEKGNYLVDWPKTGKWEHVFVLRDVRYDESAMTVTFRKVETGNVLGKEKGATRHTEDLRISSDWRSMEGHAKEDGHSLKYTRAV